MLTPDEMLKERNRLARNLSDRMRNLRKAGIDYGAIREYEDYLERYYPGQKTIGKRRNTQVSLKAEYFKLQTLLSQETSSLRGVKEINRKRRKTFSERYGIKFKNDEELRNFVQSEYFKQLSKIFDSKQAVTLIGQSKYTPNEINKRLQEYRNKTGKDRINSYSLLRTLGFRNKASAIEAIYEGMD